MTGQESLLSAPDPFDVFWAAYPRKVGKAAARKAWPKAFRAAGHDLQLILDGLEAYKAVPRDAQFTAHPSTWLNGERWNDEPEPAPRQPGERPMLDRDELLEGRVNLW